MPEPIYGVHFHRRTAAWYALSRAEQEALLKRWSTLPTKAGAKTTLTICRALAGEWEYFGVYEYPDLATRERLVNLFEESRFWLHNESTLVLGKHLSFPEGLFKVE